MRWLLTAESGAFFGIALGMFTLGWFWTGWVFVLLSAIFARAAWIEWDRWEADVDIRDLLERSRR